MGKIIFEGTLNEYNKTMDMISDGSGCPTNEPCDIDADCSQCWKSVVEFREVKPVRWRAQKGNPYYVFDGALIINQYYEHSDCLDEQYYNTGNYFQTEAEAQDAINRIGAMLSRE